MTLRPLSVRVRTSEPVYWQEDQKRRGCLKGACFLRPCHSFAGECALDPTWLNEAFRDGLFRDATDAIYVRDKFIELAKGLRGLEQRTLNALLRCFGALKVEPAEAKTRRSTTFQVHQGGVSNPQYLLRSNDVCKQYKDGYTFGRWMYEACDSDCGVTPIIKGDQYKFPEAFTVLRHE